MAEKEHRKQSRLSKKASKILFEIICEGSFEGKCIKTILPSTRRISKAKEKLWEHVRSELARRSDEEYDLATISAAWYYNLRKIGTSLDKIDAKVDPTMDESVRLEKLRTMERYVCNQLGTDRLRGLGKGKGSRDSVAREVKVTTAQMAALSRQATMDVDPVDHTANDAAASNSQPVKNERVSSNDANEKEQKEEPMDEDEMREDDRVENDMQEPADTLEIPREETNHGIPLDDPLWDVPPPRARYNTRDMEFAVPPVVSRYSTRAGVPLDAPVPSRQHTPVGMPVDGPPHPARDNTHVGIPPNGPIPSRYNTRSRASLGGAPAPSRHNTSAGILLNAPLPARYSTRARMSLNAPPQPSRHNTSVVMPLDDPPHPSRYNTPEMSLERVHIASQYNTPDTTLISRNNSSKSVSGYDADNEKGIIKRRRKGLKRRIIKIEEGEKEDEEGEDEEEDEGEMDDDEPNEEGEDGEELEDEEREEEAVGEEGEGRRQKRKMIDNLKEMIWNLREHVVSLRTIGAIDAGEMQILAEELEIAGRSMSDRE